MRYRNTGEYNLISEKVELVKFSTDYPLENFDCGVEDYNLFLTNDAKYYIDNNISSVHLLIDKESKEVIGYIALLADAFLLDKEEKQALNLNIPFSSVPALKIGKLAVSKKWKDHHYGSFLLEISLGFDQNLIENGIACRFITVDADIEYNPNTPLFYESNGFVRNQHRLVANRRNSVSMRYDVFD